MNLNEEQKKAVKEDGKNIIVSAGAGSGKTAVLGKRVIRKLKSNVNIDELLILTFTNAAALEMKSRIRKNIKEENDLKKQLELLDSAHIETFDSFASSIVRKYNYLLKISKNFKIIDSNLLNYQKNIFLNNILSEEYKSKNPILFKIISSYCDKDDKNIRDFIINLDNKLNLLIDKDDYLDNYLEKYFDENKINSDIDLYTNSLLDIIADIKLNLEEFIKSTNAKNGKKLSDCLEPLFDVKTYNELVNIEITKPRFVNLESEKEYKERIDDDLKKLSSLLRFKNEGEIKNAFLSTYDFVSFIIYVEKKLNQKIEKYKYDNNLFEFNDIAKLAIKVVKENKDIQNELKNSFKEIMIDEYQDTSDIQEEFISLISNNNVYMVGDIKQSIYRFRNANPEIFKEKYNKYQNSNDGEVIDLIKNYRSRPEVVNDINKIFISLMTSNLGGTNYLNQQMVYDNHKYDKLVDKKINYNLDILNYNHDKSIKYKENVIEAFIIASDIKKKLDNRISIYDKDDDTFRQITYKDFAILLDRSTSFNVYKKVFDYFKLPLEIWNDEKISDDTSFILLKNILNLILKIKSNEYDVEFKYLMTSIMRSPLMEASDQEIFNMYLNDDFKNNLVYEKCFKLSLDIDNSSVKDLSLKIIDSFDFYSNLIKIGNIKNSIAKIDYFLNNSDLFSQIGYSIKDYVDFLNNITNNNQDISIKHIKENGNTIKLMTIHASKGLEYPICYYAGLSNKTNRDEINKKFLFDKNIGLIVPYDLDGIDDTIYKDLYKINYLNEEISERIRLFYVALTRAREKMIIVTNNLEYETRTDMSSFNDFLKAIYPKIEKNIIDIKLDELALTREYSYIKTDNYKEEINLSNEIIDVNELNIENEITENKTFSKHSTSLIDEKTKNNMEFGLKVHECLELIDLKNPNYDNIEPFIKRKIEALLNQNIFKNIDSAKIYKEYEFMYEEDNNLYHGIIDLMLVYNNYVDIVDYKLKNIDDEAYVKQLQGYKKYIENKIGKQTNIYLYSIMNQNIKKIL